MGLFASYGRDVGFLRIPVLVPYRHQGQNHRDWNRSWRSLHCRLHTSKHLSLGVPRRGVYVHVFVHSWVTLLGTYFVPDKPWTVEENLMGNCSCRLDWILGSPRKHTQCLPIRMCLWEHFQTGLCEEGKPTLSVGEVASWNRRKERIRKVRWLSPAILFLFLPVVSVCLTLFSSPPSNDGLSRANHEPKQAFSSLPSSDQIFELLQTTTTLDLFSTHFIFLSAFQCDELKLNLVIFLFFVYFINLVIFLRHYCNLCHPDLHSS